MKERDKSVLIRGRVGKTEVFVCLFECDRDRHFNRKTDRERK